MAGSSEARSSREDRDYRSARLVAVRAWAAVGCVAVFVLAIQGLGMVGDALGLLLVGIIVGFICSPITNWLEDHHVGRGIGALIALLVVLAVLAAVIAVLAPLFLEQTLALLQHVPGYFRQVQDGLDGLWETYGSASTSDVQANVSNVVAALSSIVTKMATDAATGLSSGILPNLLGTVRSLFMFFLGLVMAYWLAKDYPTMVRELATIVGPDHEGDMTLLFAVMSRSMGGYMRGICVTSFVGGVLSFVGFTIIGHPYAGLMGITVGLLHFVPVIGPWCAAAFSAMIALFVSPVLALESLVVSTVAQNVTDNLVSPLVMQSAVKVHPVLSLLSLVVGASLGGVLGMALAIPLSAAIKGVYVYYFETKTGRQLVSYGGAIFKSTPFHNERGDVMPSFDALDDDKFFENSRLVPKGRAPKVERGPRPVGLPMNFADVVRKRVEESHRPSVGGSPEESGSSRDGDAPGSAPPDDATE